METYQKTQIFTGYLFINYKDHNNLIKGKAKQHKFKTQADCESLIWGDWPNIVFPGCDDNYVDCLSIWDHDSIVIGKYRFYYTYALSPNGAHFILIIPPSTDRILTKKAVAKLRSTHDVLSIRKIYL